jgi:ketosteroid isomerase-like protein
MGKYIDIGQAFEAALFSGDQEDMQRVLHPDLTYEMSGFSPIGGRFEGRERVIAAFENREVGLGPGFEYQQISREWFEDQANGKVFVEIYEKSWLAKHPDDLLIVRTCSVLTFEGDRIISIIDYTDSQAYSEFLERHRADIPKFAGG